jgi:hypothetical protein
MQRAKRAVQADIRARGLKVAQFSAREIALQAEAYMAQHMDELITKATADCLTFPELARPDIASWPHHDRTCLLRSAPIMATASLPLSLGCRTCGLLAP